MDLTLTRQEAKDTGIFSILTDTDGNIVAYTLEHAYQDADGNWSPKIYNGTFTCVRGQHRLASMTEDFTTFEVTGVEGHSNILYHPGNTEQDSHGCILLGEARVGDSITHSKITFNKFMELQKGLDTFTLTVV
jgi:hypothetical protein